MHSVKTTITKEQRELEKQEEIRDRKRMALVDALIKNEKINLKGHEKGWQSAYLSNMTADKNAAMYAAPIFEVGEKWARLMQVEMKKTNPPKLTPEIVKKTEDLLGEYAMRSRGLLVSSWAYGTELGRILGWSEKVISGSRKNFSNPVVTKYYKERD